MHPCKAPVLQILHFMRNAFVILSIKHLFDEIILIVLDNDVRQVNRKAISAIINVKFYSINHITLDT